MDVDERRWCETEYCEAPASHAVIRSSPGYSPGKPAPVFLCQVHKLRFESHWVQALTLDMVEYGVWATLNE